jgi:hypothetical protein
MRGKTDCHPIFCKTVEAIAESIDRHMNPGIAVLRERFPGRLTPVLTKGRGVKIIGKQRMELDVVVGRKGGKSVGWFFVGVRPDCPARISLLITIISSFWCVNQRGAYQVVIF